MAFANKDRFYISVSVVGDKEIAELNKQYRGKDSATDVLSFDMKEKLEDGTLYLGDVVVNKEQAERQSKDYNNSLEKEISELVAHGVLHLLGIHHEGDN